MLEGIWRRIVGDNFANILIISVGHKYLEDVTKILILSPTFCRLKLSPTITYSLLGTNMTVAEFRNLALSFPKGLIFNPTNESSGNSKVSKQRLTLVKCGYLW